MNLRVARHAGVLLLGLSLCAALAGGQATAPAKAAASLDARIQARMDELHRAGEFPGATVAYILPDGKSGALATGFADREARTPMNPADRMFSGSVGKTYVAAVALQLVGEGKLKLDDLASKWLGKEPWFSRLPNAEKITLRMLLNHTAGIPEYYDKPKFTERLNADLYRVWKPEELLEAILGEPAVAPAGEQFSYADTNYIVVGLIIEKCTGRTYYGELVRRILKPLKLHDTEPSVKPALRGLVPGYSTLGKQIFGFADEKTVQGGRYAFNPQMEWTGGGLISNAMDLARWARAAYGGNAVFPAALREEMLQARPMGPHAAASYGLGVMTAPTEKWGITLGHSGFMPGYLTEIAYFPEKKLAVAIQVNTDNGRAIKMSTRRFLLEVARVILDDQL